LTSIQSLFRLNAAANCSVTEGSGLSDEAIETVRDQTDALAHLLIDMYLDQQRRERANWGRHQATGSIPVWFEKGSRLKTTA